MIEQNGSVSCYPCPLCERGYELNVNCGSLITKNKVIACKHCIHGMYKDWVGPEACKPCTPCAKNEIVQSECGQTNNTVCGKCGKGFYLDNSSNANCLPCSHCCPDSADEEINECTTAGLPFHMRCSFHNSKSCKTKCGMQQIAIVPLKTLPNVKNVKHSGCINCPICPAGRGLDVPCGSTISLDEYLRYNITCVACISGKTFSEGDNSDSCKPCKLCDIGCEVIQKCNISSDTVCGNCKLGSESSNPRTVLVALTVSFIVMILFVMTPLLFMLKRYRFKKGTENIDLQFLLKMIKKNNNNNSTAKQN